MTEQTKTLQKETPQFERHDIENTPFSIIVNSESHKCKIVCGMQLMCEDEFENEIKACEYINSKPWDLILSAMALMATNIYNINNQKPQTNGN